MGLRPKKNRQPRGQCIFCGGTKLSKEHVWPNWLKNHMPRDAPHHVHLTTVGKFVDGKSWGRARNERRTGDAKARRLRVVCRTCNNEWMSKLQTTCKPLLLPFLAGQWPNLSDTEQQQLATWATMSTMVWEYAHLPTRATPREQHEYFRQTQVPPDGWKIWIGRFIGNWEGGMHHTAWKSVPAADYVDDEAIEHSADSQITYWCLGSLFLMTFSTSNSHSDVNENDFASKHRLEVLWPLQGRVMTRPTEAIDIRAANAIVRAILPPELDQRFILDIGQMAGMRRLIP
jgi:hypothetical protein